MGLRIPYVYINDIKEAHAEEPDEVHVHGDSKGIGDLSALANYRFYRAGRLSASFLAGVKFPTGRTDVQGSEGERLEAEHQPGSGSWDPMVGLAVTKRFDDISLDANILYTLVTEGTQDTDLGDAFNYNAAVSYRAAKPLDLIIEANGIVRAKQKTDGAKDPNSGEHILYLSPGIKYTWKKSMAYLSVGIPIFEDLGGEQTETDYRVIAGITIGFDKGGKP
jgi:hypothetical protein